MRNLGGLGEKTLELWAEQRGIAPQKVTHDKTGWDYLLEFPLTHGTALDRGFSLDREPYPLRCLVQVKATDGRDGSVDIKLSNWEWFVKNPFPAFFLVLEFDGQVDCQQAYLVHVGEEYIRRVLKRLREVPADQRQNLHKQSMEFKYTVSEKLPSLNGQGLEQAIRSYIKGSSEEYTREKDKLVQTVGYETGYLVRLTILPPQGVDIQEYLTDFSIGLVPYLEVTAGSIIDNRFGIEDPNPIEVFGEGSRLVPQIVSKGTTVIRLTSGDGRQELRIETDTYIPEHIPGVSLQYFKMRLVAPFFSMVMKSDSSSRGNGILHVDSPDPALEYELSTLRIVSDVVAFIHESEQRGHRISYSLSTEGTEFANGSFNSPMLITPEVIKYMVAIKHARNIARFFDFPLNIQVKPGEFFMQKQPLSMMGEVITNSSCKFIVSGTVTTPLPIIEGQYCYPVVLSALIGPYRVILGVAFIGELRVEGEIKEASDKYTLTISRTVIERKQTLYRDEALSHIRDELLDEIAEKYKDSMHVLRTLD